MFGDPWTTKSWKNPVLTNNLPVWPDGKIYFQYLATYTDESLLKSIKNPKVGSIISPMRYKGFKNW